MLDTVSNMDRTPLHIIVPVVMYCAMLFWIGRHFTWTQRLTVTVVTLTLPGGANPVAAADQARGNGLPAAART